MSFPLRSFRPPFAAIRVRVLLAVVLSFVVALAACLNDAPTALSTGPVKLRINAQVSGDGGGGGPPPMWTVNIRVYYWTSGEDRIPLPVDPSSVQLGRDQRVEQAVEVDITPCLADENRANNEGDAESGCRLYVELSLLDADGNLLSTDTQDALASVPGETLEDLEFVLPPGEILASDTFVEFTAPDNGEVPGSIDISLSSSTSEQLGTLSQTVQYLSGSNWLARQLVESEGVGITLGPSTTQLAPGTYEAVVTVTSARDFVPVEIFVRYVVTNRPKRATITGAGNGSGDITLNELDANCTIVAGTATGTCNPFRPHGAPLTLTASPLQGSSFVGWSGACTGTAACVLTMDQDRAVTATFTLVPRQLTVTTAGVGNGTVTSAPAAITCTRTNGVQSGTCAAAFNHGTQVTLTPVAQTGTSLFAGWSGGGCTGTAPCTVTMDQARTVTATFNLIQRTLTITGAGNGQGSIVLNELDASCTIVAGNATGTCTPSLAHGSQLTLIAGPSEGSSFVGWSGACTGTGACVLTMDQNRAVTATFTLVPKRLTVTIAGDGNGSVFSTPTETISCTKTGTVISGQCTSLFTHGSQVTLTTFAPTGFAFVGWSGACTGMTACVLTMDQDRAVTATFSPTTQRLTITGTGSGTGLVFTSDELIDCTITGGQTSGDCVQDYPAGAQVAVQREPTGGGSFGGWSGACSGTGACVVVMDKPQTVTARFNGPPPPGRDIVVFNDFNVFDATAMANPNNQLMVRNLVSFTSPGSRDAGRIVQMDCGRSSRVPSSCPAPSPAFASSVQQAGFSLQTVNSTPGSMTSIGASVKVLFLWLPCQEYSREEVNVLKAFASEGGRIIFVGEHVDFFGACIPTRTSCSLISVR